MIICENLTFKYENSERNALTGVNLRIKKGEFIAVLGANGSGKSTLAKHFNALLIPESGNCIVDGDDTCDEEKTFIIRSKCGMVFQNPDNQIVSGVVEEDVAFAAENLGLPSEKIRERVDSALERVGMTEYAKHAPHLLSGGQKQRIAIAGILAMNPDCIVLDEPTAMLDPRGRKSVLSILKNLHESGKTIVLITHNMNEAALADRIIVMQSGKIVAAGTPREVYGDVAMIEDAGLELPQTAQLMHKLGKPIALTVDDAIEVLQCSRLSRGGLVPSAAQLTRAGELNSKRSTHEATVSQGIEMKNVTYTYSQRTPFEKTAVDGVSLTVQRGEILGIIGHTGSGKSTLIQMINGLLKPTSGEVFADGEEITRITSKVGMVFQYPENQIFEETIRSEIAFGPRNLGVAAEEIENRIQEVCGILDIDNIDKSPHFLSGGQKRRVAIASILAMKPHTIIFDEPTAGLDPRAKNHLLNTILQLNKNGATIIIVSHSMDDIAKIAHRVAVMNDARIADVGAPEEVFARVDELVAIGLDIPEIAQIMQRLGYNNCWTVEQAAEVLSLSC